MPFGKWENFNECVLDMEKQGYDNETAKKICGTLERELKKKGERDVTVKNQNAKESLEERISQVRRAFESRGDLMESNSMVIHVFEDTVITQQFGTGQYYEVPYTIDDDGKITKGEPKEVDLVYIQKRLNNSSAELTGPIFKADEKQRIVYAAVLVPGEPDHDFEKGEKLLTAEEIEQVAHKWMEDYGNIDYMHGMNNVAKPVESFILPFEWEVTIGTEKTKLPEGTWILAGKVTNDKAWKEVEEGKLTGFSIMGIQNTVLKDIMKKVADGEPANKQFESSLKRVLIRDLGKDWIVPFVSLVDEPCVPKAKFFAIKEKEKTEIEQEDKEGVWAKVVNYFKKDDFGQMTETVNKLNDIAEKAGRSISDATYNDLKKAIDSLQKLIEKADKERKPDYMKNKKKSEGDELDMKEEEVLKMIEDKIDEKMKPVLEGIESLKKQETEKTKEPEKTEKAKEPEDNKTEIEKLQESYEALKSENEKLKKEKDGQSKVEKGQEDGKTKVVEKSIYEELGRDDFGRKIEKGEEEDV
jgi:hypothetical protein